MTFTVCPLTSLLPPRNAYIICLLLNQGINTTEMNKIIVIDYLLANLDHYFIKLS